MKKDYDKTLTRLVGILSFLSNDERPTTKELAEEFGVGIRTIQNDVYKRLLKFPIEKDNDGKLMFTKGFTLNKSLLSTDEMMLVSLALSQFEEVSDFDRLTSSTLKKLLNPSTFNPYFIKQDDIEDIDIDSKFIQDIEEAIKFKNHLVIIGHKGEIEVEPYKIAAYEGIWYLVAKDVEDAKAKTFMLSRIKKIKVLKKKHNVSQQYIDQLLDKTHSAWFEEGNCFEVKVKVYPRIANYFKQKDFLQSQELHDEYEDGSLLISFDVSHYEDIDNIIKSWLPDIEVIEPIQYREKIQLELKEYLTKIS